MKLKNIFLTFIFFFFFPTYAGALPREIVAVWQYPQIDNISEFRLYQENNLVCSTADPQATTLSCTIDTPDGETWFTLTAVFSDGTESAHSSPLTFIFSSGLKALFSSDVTGGESPLPVTFDASNSSGNIISYEWMFGDGEVATGNLVNHTFATAGIYNVSLKVTDDVGAYDQNTSTITVTTPTVENIAPTAVLASSTSAGTAPLPVQFDGSDSTDSDGVILDFGWDFGDGGSASGPTADHIYNIAGTFSSALTVTDDGGMSDSVSTPVLVEPSPNSNKPPVAVLQASVKGGKLPIMVRFSGHKSYDEDGNIISYSWNFGDGTVGSGERTEHKYSVAGQYQIALQVTDNDGAVSQFDYFIFSTNGDGAPGIDGSIAPSAATRVIINFLLLHSPSEEKADKKTAEEQNNKIDKKGSE